MPPDDNAENQSLAASEDDEARMDAMLGLDDDEDDEETPDGNGMLILAILSFLLLWLISTDPSILYVFQLEPTAATDSSNSAGDGDPATSQAISERPGKSPAPPLVCQFIFNKQLIICLLSRSSRGSSSLDVNGASVASARHDVHSKKEATTRRSPCWIVHGIAGPYPTGLLEVFVQAHGLPSPKW